MKESLIHHPGIVEGIEGKYLKVRITSYSACSACHSKASCSLSESKEKELLVPLPREEYKEGERVDVIMQETLGTMAVLLSYVFPIILFIGGIVVAYTITKNEPITGLSGVIILIVYFVLLFLFRSQLEKKFVISVRKQ